jgi:hypothetical protein
VFEHALDDSARERVRGEFADRLRVFYNNFYKVLQIARGGEFYDELLSHVVPILITTQVFELTFERIKEKRISLLSGTHVQGFLDDSTPESVQAQLQTRFTRGFFEQ